MPVPPDLTPAKLRSTYLPGLALEDGDGRPMPDATLTSKIRVAVAAFERKYAVRLTETTVKVGARPFPDEPTPDETHPGIDFDPDGARDNRQHLMWLPVAPIREVLKLGLYLPLMDGPVTLPNDWAPAMPRTAGIRVYPGKTLDIQTFGLVGGGFGLSSTAGIVPNAWHITYRAGYTEDDLTGQDYDVLDAVNKLAALEVLVPGSVDRHLADGVTGRSVSVDGLSQSLNLIQNSQALKYAPLVAAYQAEVQAWAKTYWARQSGPRMITV